MSIFITAGQISDYTGAAALLDDLPKAQWMLADRGYDAEWFKDALKQKGIKPCIPGWKSGSLPVRYDKRRYRRRNRIEIMFGRLKDWRRVAMRYDRCPIAPRKLFMASKSDILRSVQSLSKRDRIARHNRAVVRNASIFVGGTDLSQEAFITANFGAQEHQAFIKGLADKYRSAAM